MFQVGEGLSVTRLAVRSTKLAFTCPIPFLVVIES